MSLEQTVAAFKEYLDKQYALGCAIGTMHWDASTGAPKGGAQARAKRIGILSAEHFKMQVSPQMKEFLDELGAHKDELDEITQALYRLTKKDYDESVAVPPEFIGELSEAQAISEHIWEKAKNTNDFALFAPYLEKMIGLQKRLAHYLNPNLPAYDVLLNTYEEGMMTKELDVYFATLREKIVPLLKKIMESGNQKDNAFRYRAVPIETQRKIGQLMMDTVGYNLHYGMIAESEHPFSTSFGKHDCRITVHYHEHDFLAALYATLHEAGHATYEMNPADEIANTILDSGTSNGVHESQSRFYENYIGRSRAFCELVWPKLSALLGADFADVTLDDFYRCVNHAEPSLIRIEADELTYSLHIMVRYEIEKLMFTTDVNVNDLPALWNAKIKEYIGVDVPEDKLGVLQDVHWSGGMFGYFPSYSLGSAYGAQFYYTMKKELDFDSLVRSGDIKAVTAWLTDKIHKYGSMKTPKEIMLLATGEEFNPEYYAQYLTEKFSTIYGL